MKEFLSFKWIAGSILGLATLAIIGVNVHLIMKSNKDFSDVELKNIEALSQEAQSGYAIVSCVRVDIEDKNSHTVSTTVNRTCSGYGEQVCECTDANTVQN
jgi:hypothetical protein